jgi:hypothetical protein
MQSALRVEILEVLEGIHVQWVGISEFDLSEILNPLIFQGLLGRNTVLWVEGKHLGDNILSAL